MRCPCCGADVDDESLFCPRCGTALTCPASQADNAADGDGKQDTAPLLVIDLPPDALRKGPLKEQFSDARERSRHRIPLFLLIIMLMLFLVAFTALAYTAYLLFERYVAPYFAQQEYVELVEDRAGDADLPPRQPEEGGASPDASAQNGPEDDGSGEPEAEAPAPVEQEPVPTEQDPAKQAVYNAVLAEYRDSQAQGWSNALGSDLVDLSSLGVIVQTQADMNVGITYDQLSTGTVSYAYADFGNDDALDLAIASVQDDGTYQLIALYVPSESAEPVSIMNGSITTRTAWKVLPDLQLERSGSLSGWEWRANVYLVEGSALAGGGAYGYDSYGYYREDAGGERTYISLEEYQGMRNGPSAELDWRPLDEFVEVEAGSGEAAPKAGSTSEAGQPGSQP